MPEAKITVTAQDLSAETLKQVKGNMDGLGESAKTTGEKLKAGIEDPMTAIKGAAIEAVEGIGPLGIGVVALGGVAIAAAAAIYELASAAAEVGGHINDVSEKTGVSVPMVDRYGKAFEVAGGSLDTFSSSMFMLQKNIGEASQKTDDGLKKIGLSTSELKAAGPDHYMELIAQGFKNTEDPAAKASAAMDIFGRQGREIIPVLEKLAEGLEKTGDITPWTAEQSHDAEQFEMQMKSMVVHAEAFATSIGRDLIEPVGTLIGGIKDGVVWVGNFGNALPSVFTPAKLIGSALSEAAAAVAYLRGEADKLPKVSGDAKIGLDAWRKSVEANALAHYEPGSKASLSGALFAAESSTHDLDAAARASIESHKKAAEETQKWSSLLNEFDSVGGSTKATLDGMNQSVVEGTKFYLEQNVAVGKIAKLYGITVEQVNAVKQSMDDQAKSMKAEIELIHDSEKAGTSAQDAIGKSFGGMPTVLMNLSVAMGDTQLATTGFVGTMGLMTDLSVLAKQRMFELRDSLPSLAHALRDTFESIPQMISSALTGGGGIDGAVKAIGSTLGTNIGGEIAGNLANTLTDGGTKALSGMASGMLKAIPVIGSMIGPALSLLFKIGGPSQAELDGRKIEASFEQSFGGFQKMMDAVGHAYDQAGLGAQRAQSDVKALMDAEKLGGDAAKAAADKIKGVLDDTAQDTADLDAATQRYGFSLEQLGPTMQKQKLDAQAQQLTNDFRLLAGSGMDIVTVDQKMASSTWDYLQMAKKTGQEVPAAMKPVLQSMIDQGVFTDENGDKLTDLKSLGVTFSDTMTEAMSKIADKLSTLIDKIGAMALGLKNMPTKVTTEIQTVHTDIYQKQDSGEQSFANEGFDLSTPQRAIVGDSPFSSESVLHASTVRDIVKAARRAGTTTGGSASDEMYSALSRKFEGMQKAVIAQTQEFKSAMLRLPKMMIAAQQLG